MIGSLAWRRQAAAGLFFALVLLSASGPAPAAAEGARIVAIGGALTEIVYALGAEGELVGVDSTSQFPPAARAKPIVGYMRTLAAEGVLSLAPSLILATDDAGPPTALAQLRAAGVKTVVLTNAHDLVGTRARIQGVADALGRSAQGRRLADRVETDIKTIVVALAKLPDRPRVLFLLATGQGAPLVSGRGTAADAMIALAGGANAVTGYDGYKPLTPEAAIGAAPDIIMVPSHAVTHLGNLAAVAQRPGLAATPAARNGRIVEMDGLLLLGFGPRLAEAVRQLAVHLHPGLGPLPVARPVAQ